MRIAALCRCDQTGLGIQAKEFFDHVSCKALVIDVSRCSSTMKQNHDWYPGQTVWYYSRGAKFSQDFISDFLKDVDVLITFETPYDYSLFSYCRLMGVKTVLQLNYEFLEYPSSFPLPDLFAAPSMWNYNDIPYPKVFLPVPVNIKKFTPKWREKTFVHVAGKPAIHDRNGTNVFLNSLQYVKNPIKVILHCQKDLVVPKLPSHIDLQTDFSNKPNYADNYDGGVMVLPRKYGGLSLVVNESLAAGMPVIMPDISPNNLWLPKEWLVPAIKTTSFKCKKTVDIYETESMALAIKIDEFCSNERSFGAAERAAEMGRELSWENLLPLYLQTLSSL